MGTKWNSVPAVCLVVSLLAGCVTPVSPPSATEAIATIPASPTPDPVTESLFSTQRQVMVDRTIAARGINDPLVLQAMSTVPRHLFVLPQHQDQAYADHPLPIGFGQTISQPYIVALMTQLLELKPDDKVLEIGTGSGYQAAVLAEILDRVYTIEIIPELADRATATLQSAGYDNVRTRQADGYFGWPEEAPFDAIIVTAAPDHVPQPLVQQLKEGGRLIVPIGPPGGYQSLWAITRRSEHLDAVNVAGVRFVPLVGGGQAGDDYSPPEDRFLDPPG